MLRLIVRVVGWNALLLFAAAVLIAAAGEAWFRLTKPFMDASFPAEFVPNIGWRHKPNTEMRYTNQTDYWVVSRVNSLGFLDREPPSPERAAASCHVSVIGDSFVEAREVPIDRKFQVRLEQLAAAALPRLDVTASAFGHTGTGQIQQLPFYDEYARRLRPKLVVLVFFTNDFAENSSILQTLYNRSNPPCPPREFSAARLPDGTMELRPPPPACPPPDADTPGPEPPEIKRTPRVIRAARKVSWFAKWLNAKLLAPQRASNNTMRVVSWLEWTSRNPAYSAYFKGWSPAADGRDIHALMRMFARKDLPPVFEDALDYTVFALEQFKQRADRDGAKLVILAAHGVKIHGIRAFERMSAMAAALDIPVIDQAAYILRQGAALTDAQWRGDLHWNDDGHRWAAEALLEWLQENQEVCGGGADSKTALQTGLDANRKTILKAAARGAGGASHAGNES